MKFLLTTLPTLVLSLFTSIVIADVVMLEDFEDSTVNYTVTQEFHDGANDYFGIVPLSGAIDVDDGPYTGFAGSNFFGAEDIDDNGGPGLDFQTLEFSMDITGYSSLTFSTLFAAGANDNANGETFRYDDLDGVRITAQIDGGAIQNLLAFESDEVNGEFNSQLRIDSDFDGVGDAGGLAPTAAFSNFGGIAIAGMGSNLVLRIEVYMDAAHEEVAFDNVMIEGVASVPEPSSTILLMGMFGAACMRRRKSPVA